MKVFKNCEEVSNEEHELLMRTLHEQGMVDKDIYLIHTSRLFSGTSMDELESMIGCLYPEVRQFKEGQMILRNGDRVETVGLILKGSARIEKEDFWGNKTVIEELETPQTFGTAYACSPSSVADVDVIAVTDVKAIFFNIKKILTVCSMGCEHHSRIVRNLIGELAEKNLYLTNKLSHVVQRTTRAKLLQYFSDEAKKAGAHEFEIKFSRQELADYLAVDRSGLSVEIGKLCDEGLLESHKNHFTVKFN